MPSEVRWHLHAVPGPRCARHQDRSNQSPSRRLAPRAQARGTHHRSRGRLPAPRTGRSLPGSGTQPRRVTTPGISPTASPRRTPSTCTLLGVISPFTGGAEMPVPAGYDSASLYGTSLYGTGGSALTAMSFPVARGARPACGMPQPHRARPARPRGLACSARRQGPCWRLGAGCGVSPRMPRRRPFQAGLPGPVSGRGRCPRRRG